MEYYAVFDDVLARDVTAGVEQQAFLLLALVLILGVAAAIVLAVQVSQLLESPRAIEHDADEVDSTSLGERDAA
ncbi:MAG: hypothetical protein KDC46_06800 [Thermoleophilia bacterium]|nr:hypothetical protein [Thermoleophilia bacterium]